MRKISLIAAILLVLPSVIATFDIDGQKADFNAQYYPQTFETDNVVMVTQTGVEFADIEMAVMESQGKLYLPTMAVQNGNDVLQKLLKWDNDVIEVHNKPVKIVFPVSGTLHLVANEHAAAHSPLRYPANGYSTNNIQRGKINYDGRLDSQLGTPTIQEWWTPGTGHPAGWLIGWIKGDNDYLYFAFDVTADNTDDVEDWFAITVQTNSGEQRYYADAKKPKYALNSFQYTDSVTYEHNVIEFRIPRDKIGNNINWNLEYYGTAANTLCVGLAPNGVLEPGEECDDGNIINGDGCSDVCTLEKEVEGVLLDLYTAHNLLFSKVQDLAHLNKDETMQVETKVIQMGLREAYLNSPTGNPCEVPPNLFQLTADLHPYGKENEIDAYNNYLMTQLSDSTFRAQIGVTDDQYNQALIWQLFTSLQLDQTNLLTSAQAKCCWYNQLIETEVLEFDPETGICTSTTPDPNCGNGIIELGEECDPPTFPPACGGITGIPCCDLNCIDPFCGDGTVDAGFGEQCELPNTATCDAFCQDLSGGPGGSGGGSGSGGNAAICPPSCASLTNEQITQNPYCAEACPNRVISVQPEQQTAGQTTPAQQTQPVTTRATQQTTTECTADGDCSIGFECNNGKCVQKQPEEQKPIETAKKKFRISNTLVSTGLGLIVLLLILALLVNRKRPEQPQQPPHIQGHLDDMEESYKRIEQMLEEMRKNSR